jgi:transcriptional regulator with XRE-family HTH domain
MEINRQLNLALAKVIREARETKGMTQGQLAGFAGLSEVYLSRVECGKRGASINALIQMAGALKIPAAELMRRIETELAQEPEKLTRKIGRPGKDCRSDSL